MRKWTTLLLIALISLFLVACKGEDDKDKDSSKEDDTPNTSEQEKEDDTADEDDETDENESSDDKGTNEGTNNNNTAGEDLGFDFNPNGENIVTLQSEQNGVQIKLVYTADGDKVQKQTAENVIPYSSLGVQSAEEAKQIPQFVELIEQYKGVNGIKHNMDFKENEIHENLEVDYSVIQYEEVKDLLGFQSEGDLTNGVSLIKSIEMLQGQGFEIVE